MPSRTQQKNSLDHPQGKKSFKRRTTEVKDTPRFPYRTIWHFLWDSIVIFTLLRLRGSHTPKFQFCYLLLKLPTIWQLCQPVYLDPRTKRNMLSTYSLGFLWSELTVVNLISFTTNGFESIQFLPFKVFRFVACLYSSGHTMFFTFGPVVWN